MQWRKEREEKDDRLRLEKEEKDDRLRVKKEERDGKLRLEELKHLRVLYVFRYISFTYFV